MLTTRLPKSISKFLAGTVVLSFTHAAKAVAEVPEVKIQCLGFFQAHILFDRDFSTWGPKLNRFAGHAQVAGSGTKEFEVRGHQVQNAKQGDPIFWILTLVRGATSAEVVLTQQHDWQSTAYGALYLPGGKEESLSCLVLAR